MTKTQTRSLSHRPRLQTSRWDVLGNVTPRINPKTNHAAAQPVANVVDVVDAEVALLATTKVDTILLIRAPYYLLGQRTIKQDKTLMVY